MSKLKENCQYNSDLHFMESVLLDMLTEVRTYDHLKKIIHALHTCRSQVKAMKREFEQDAQDLTQNTGVN